MSIKHEVNRLKLLWKFFKVSHRAKEVELAWQKLQQDEHDSHFKFESLRGDAQLEYIYKKGISEGVKWCLNRFS